MSDHIRIKRSIVRRFLLILSCALLIGGVVTLHATPDAHAAAPQQAGGPAVCGNGICESTETSCTCSADCTEVCPGAGTTTGAAPTTGSTTGTTDSTAGAAGGTTGA